MFYGKLATRYKQVRRYLPSVLKHLKLSAGTGGRDVLQALNYFHVGEVDPERPVQPPLGVITTAWEKHVRPDGETVEPIKLRGRSCAVRSGNRPIVVCDQLATPLS